jgi:hypothetical protein
MVDGVCFCFEIIIHKYFSLFIDGFAQLFCLRLKNREEIGQKRKNRAEMLKNTPKTNSRRFYKISKKFQDFFPFAQTVDLVCRQFCTTGSRFHCKQG